MARADFKKFLCKILCLLANTFNFLEERMSQQAPFNGYFYLFSGKITLQGNFFAILPPLFD
jgi:hypothetical protein